MNLSRAARDLFLYLFGGVKNKRFYLFFNVVGKFEALAREKLDAVEFHAVVRCGYHNSCIGFSFLNEICNCRCRNNSEDNSVRTDGADTCRKCSFKNIGGYSCVLADKDFRFFM